MIGVVTRVRALLASDFIRHGAIVFVASMLVNVFGYVFHFALSRKLGVVRYGELSALNAAFMISIVVPTIGSTIVVKYATAFHTAHDGPRLAALSRRLARVAAIGAIASLVVLLALAAPIAAFLQVDDRLAVALAMTMIALSMAAGTMRGLYQGEEDFNGYAVSLVLESLLKMIAGIGLAYAGFGVAGAFGGWAIGSLVAFAYTTFVLLGKARGVRGAPLDIHVGALARTMTGVAAATVLLSIVQNADLLVVKHFVGPTEAGLYGALSLAGKILLFFVAFVPLVVLPKATRLALSGEPPGRILLQALGVSVALSFPGLLFYALEPRLVVTLLAGNAFAAAAPYVLGYGFAMVELAILSVLVSYKIGIHRFDFVIPLAICAIGEVAGISAFHATLDDVIRVLVVGNFLAAALTSWRVWERAPAAISEPSGFASVAETA
jgi:O-antigen/teichoic acid export membrane protein